jgi:thymidine kinase
VGGQDTYTPLCRHHYIEGHRGCGGPQ